MDPKQFKLFQQITLDYFAKLAPGDEPTLGDAFLQFGEARLCDYTSLVRIHGEYDGCIFLTTPIAMLENLLEINGEPEVSPRTLRDMCRELSNVLSGNASQAFGGNWEISVPISLSASEVATLDLPDSTFVLPIAWRGVESLLVVGLTPGDVSENGGAR
ncbi:MAG: chemotaxis protein CheX [Acidobacteriota bacterium]